MVQIDPDGWLIKELDFEKSAEENLFQLEHASCVLCRIDAARRWPKQDKDRAGGQQALAAAWKQEKSRPPAPRWSRSSLAEPRLTPGPQMMGARQAASSTESGDEAYRQALLEAAKDPEAPRSGRGHRGLAKLKKTPESEAILRAAWSNPKEAYGARKAALRGLVAWKVKDADELLGRPSKIPAGKHTLAATALELCWNSPARKPASSPRSIPSTVSRGPFARRRSPPSTVWPRTIQRSKTWSSPWSTTRTGLCGSAPGGCARSFKLKKALPALEARLGHENFGFTGFTGFGVRQLQEAIAALKEPATKAPASAAPTADQAKPIAELERQAEELETKARELRKRIEAMKTKLSAQ